jgi:hypothetical protein
MENQASAEFYGENNTPIDPLVSELSAVLLDHPQIPDSYKRQALFSVLDFLATNEELEKKFGTGALIMPFDEKRN